MPQNEPLILRVEGKDDEFVIKNLLSRHNIDHTNVKIKWAEYTDENTGGRGNLLEGMKTEIKGSVGQSVGFILDADGAPEDCWRAVRNRLEDVGLTLPLEIPVGGFVGDSVSFRTRVGVWLMPDNLRHGALEEFLRDLVNNEDTALFQLAETSTTSAKERGAAFPEAKRLKATLHTWLAWQQRPGVPYGLAITARYFSHNSPAALAFVEWFRHVFAAPAGQVR